MVVRKLNEFLDGDDSEDDLDTGYDSEAVEQSKGDLTARATKRRKLEDARFVDEDDFSAASDEERKSPSDIVQDGGAALLESTAGTETLTLPGNGEDGLADEDELERPAKRTKLKGATPKSVTVAEKAAKASGVIYISRVPPFMKPQTLRHFLIPHASKGIGKIFLTPESQGSHSNRVRNGGNKKKSFTDGWVEFLSKKEAKVAVELLNGNIIGGKKGNFYHDDLWNMKYLRGFKWSHLTEQMASENAERSARMREEIRRNRVENKRFVDDYEKGKMLEGMAVKAQAKKDRGGEGGDSEAKSSRPKKVFKQRKVENTRNEGADQKAAEVLQRAGRKIF